jgi:7-cyano-7-deazaguanine reductase
VKGTHDSHDKGPLLGRTVAGSTHYDPSLLFPVPRRNARSRLPGGAFHAFGEDVWQCYELSWLDGAGIPCAYVGLLTIPGDSENLVESKSLKLYLNSLNNHRFASDAEALQTIERDVGSVVGAPVRLSLYAVTDPAFDGGVPEGLDLDALKVAPAARPDAAALSVSGRGEMRCFTHRLRSLCPVTAQPDWGSLLLHCRGPLPDVEPLVAYLLSFRDHQEFHEQCVERIYSDLARRLEPEYLSVQALYTRRGGLAICPWRCSEDRPSPRLRLNRQ